MWDITTKKIIFNTIASVLFLLLLFKLFHLQIYENKSYFRHSENNRIRRYVLQPNRGLIYDRNGVVLVDNNPSYVLSAIPYECTKQDTILNILSEMINVSPTEIKYTLNSAESPFSHVRIKRNIDYKTLIKIEERKIELPGITHDVDPKRFYPSGVQAPHLFGYLGEITRNELEKRKGQGLFPGDLVGKAGIEKMYDSVLRGKVGFNYVEVDAFGREVRDIAAGDERDPQRGNDLYLTIDANLQKQAEQSFEGKQGGVVLMDVRTGGVLVLCSSPSYEPHTFTDVVTNKKWRALVNDPRRPLYDRMLQSTFPPGSTFKLVLAAAAIEEGIIESTEEENCPGYYRLGRRYFKCWKSEGHGNVDLIDAIKQSCNVYFYKTSLKVGVEKWADYARKFGFGQPTGIDIVGESKGLVPDISYLDKTYGKGGWTKGLLLNLGIGQGDLLVTPMQMAQYAMMVANGGVYYQPHLLHSVHDTVTGDTLLHSPLKNTIDDISTSTFEVLRKGMYKVVNEENGTGRASQCPGIYVAGKTGTAQNPHGDSHAWFIGFAPYQSPEVAICVFVENGGGGGANAAPIAGKLFRTFFKKSRNFVHHIQ